MSKTFYFQWEWQLQSSPEALWDYVSNTNRFNKVTGMPKVRFETIPLQNGKTQIMANAKIAGFDVIWEDSLFEWVRPRSWRAERLFSSKIFPARRFLIQTTLHPGDHGGTRLELEMWAESRGGLGRWLTKTLVAAQGKSFDAAFRQMDDFLQNLVTMPYKLPPVTYDDNGRRRMEQIISQLHDSGVHRPGVVDFLKIALLERPLDDLVGMRPYAFADEWGLERDEVLSLFLHAASRGLLDLRWALLCPECRAAKASTPSLASLPEQVHCDTCNIDYSSNFDLSVEAIFDISDALITTEYKVHCIGGPHTQRHVLMAQLLPAQESRDSTVPLSAGTYRIRAPRLKARDGVLSPVASLTPLPGQPWLQADPASPIQAATIHIAADETRIEPSVVGVGNVVLSIHNETEEEQSILLEDSSWTDQIATALDVTAIQDFRDLFSSEALRPGLTVSIENMVILFTDLKDSTALYRSIGDASAFGKVIDHFGILREVIREEQGAIVKTIGDAVMAVFRRPDRALRAAVQMVERMQTYSQVYELDNPLRLKIGIHQGPCIAVTLNERLDYFGSTVNIAARLENQARGDDIVISQAIMSDAAVVGCVENLGLSSETFSTELRGFDSEYQLYRLRLATPPNPT